MATPSKDACPNCAEPYTEENFSVGACYGCVINGGECPNGDVDLCWACAIVMPSVNDARCAACGSHPCAECGKELHEETEESCGEGYDDCVLGGDMKLRCVRCDATNSRFTALEAEVELLKAQLVPQPTPTAAGPLCMGLAVRHGGKSLAIKLSPASEKDLATQLLKAVGQDKVVLSAHYSGVDIPVATTAAMERELSVQVLRKVLGSEVELTLSMTELSAALPAAIGGAASGGAVQPAVQEVAAHAKPMSGLMPSGLGREEQLAWAQTAYPTWKKTYQPHMPAAISKATAEEQGVWMLDVAYPQWVKNKEKKNKTQGKWYTKSKVGGGGE